MIRKTSSSDNDLFVIHNGANSQLLTLDQQTLVYKTDTTMWTQETMVADNGRFRFTDTAGNRIYFNNFSTVDGLPDGLFSEMKDPYGNVTNVVSNTADRITEIQRCNASVCESYLYSYYASGPNINQLEWITLRRGSSSTGWTTARKVNYVYYDETTNEDFGSAGDIKLVKYYAGTDTSPFDTAYYRYYTDEYSGSNPGFIHGLHLVFGPESYARLIKDYPTDWATASNGTVAPYANLQFEYDDAQRVAGKIVQGAGGGSGRGIYTYSYETNDNDDPVPTETDHKHWFVKTVQTYPDHTETDLLVH